MDTTGFKHHPQTEKYDFAVVFVGMKCGCLLRRRK
jgi:hypothetical protein